MRARRRQIHGLSAALAAGALLALALAPAAAAAPPDLTTGVKLSDQRTYTRWAHADEAAPIRESPKPNAWEIGTLALSTEDGLPEVYVLLRSWTDPEGMDWLEIRVPMRPKARTGWVEASALSASRVVRTQLVVNRRHLRASLYRGGRRIWSSPVGVGAAGTPTPGGRYWIRERLRSKRPGGIYGRWAFGTSAYASLSDWPGGGVVGIHGTNQPDLIPGRPSHGCIRVPNRAMSRLARLMPLGTPVWIR